MSVNPLGGGALPPNIAALIAEELAALAADAQTLAARLSPGDVVAAVVLPSNGLTDLLDIGGLRVAADLPPTLVPGEGITVMVTGFAGDRINLQIIPTSAAAPESAAAAATLGAPRVRPSKPAPTGRTSGAPPAPAGRTSTAPPAGAGRTSAAPPAPAGQPSAALPAPAGRTSAAPVAPGAPAAPRAAAGPALPPRAAVGAPTSPLATIEARLATAHATLPPVPRPAAAAPTTPFAATVARAAARPAIPPISSPISAPLRLPAEPLPASGNVPEAPRGPAAFSEPAALLRALHLAVTPTNVALARIAFESPEKLPNALATLERALAGSTDPHLATLTTLTSFLAKLDPRSPVFATQIAAFADHIVTGREARLAQLAGSASDAPQHAAPPAAASGAAENVSGLSAADREGAAVARAALDFDLKSQLLTVAAARADGADTSPAGTVLDRAVAGALCAITALQLTAATTLTANPDGLSFVLPVALPNGFARARIRVGRDAPDHAGTPLDGDNFHIAFVLDTQHLGTIAIELVTVGRTVSVSVKTEAALAHGAFRSALGKLTARLETLKYRVAKADAVIAPHASDVAAQQPRPAPPPDTARRVDVDA